MRELTTDIEISAIWRYIEDKFSYYRKGGARIDLRPLRPAGQYNNGNNNNAKALYVNNSGYVNNNNVNNTNIGVRPAFL